MDRRALFVTSWDELTRDEVKPKNSGESRCKICEHILSVYNAGPYCFAHEQVGMAIDDEVDELRDRANQTKYKGRTTRYTKEYNKKYYERIRKAKQ